MPALVSWSLPSPNTTVRPHNGGLRRSPLRGPGAESLEAETLLAFDRLMEAANLLTFQKICNAKNHIQCVLSLQKNEV